MAVIRRFPLASEAATAALAAALAPRLRAGDALLLDGPLGAGKTSFARALIRQLAGSGTSLPRPTFNLVLTFYIAGVTFWHFVRYPIDHPRPLHYLRFDVPLSPRIT